MKISYNWLKEFIDIQDKPEVLSQKLADFGIGTEEIIKTNNDFILDLELTANRGDCLSILGIIRELSIIYGKDYKLPETKYNLKKSEKKIDISINKNVCLRYSAVVIENVNLDKSEDDIINKLSKYDFKPINNIVDITNLVMIETGQPLHAFDYDKIENSKIILDTVNKPTILETLDGQTRNLITGDIVIKDNKKIYDLTGIMGANNSKIDNNTKTIVLQAAVFDPATIRNTSKRLRLSTDASYRYERGVDFGNTLYALNRAVSLISKYSPNAKISQIYDIKNYKTTTITINKNKINDLIGLNLTENQIKNYLNKLNFNYQDSRVTIPTYRHFDINIWQDIAEEITKIYGYKNLKPEDINSTPKKNISEYEKREGIKDIVGEKFNEIYSYAFLDHKTIQVLDINPNNCIQIKEPKLYLRPSLLPSLLAAASKNPWAPEINIFEIGKVFGKKEFWQLGILTTIKKASNIKEILLKLNINTEIKSLDKSLLDKLKIRKNIYYVLINIDDIKLKKGYENIKEITKFNQVSAFPPTILDISIIVDKNTSNLSIEEEIKNTNPSVLLVELFDEYISDKLGENKKSIAFHIWIQNLNGPVSKEESQSIFEKIAKQLQDKFDARLR